MTMVSGTEARSKFAVATKGAVLPPSAAVSMIVGVRAHGNGSTLVLRGPDRCERELRVDETPSDTSADREIPSGSKPLAIRIDLAHQDESRVALNCTCIVTDVAGPRRIPVSASTALFLLATGRNGIVSTKGVEALTS